MSSTNKAVVYAALLGNLAIALVKFIAAYITNSSAMLSEAVHSVVDTLNEILSLYGMKKSQQPANSRHPFGWAGIVFLGIYCRFAGIRLRCNSIHLSGSAAYPLSRRA